MRRRDALYRAKLRGEAKAPVKRRRRVALRVIASRYRKKVWGIIREHMEWGS